MLSPEVWISASVTLCALTAFRIAAIRALAERRAAVEVGARRWTPAWKSAMSGTSVAVPFPSTAIVGVVSVVWAAAGAASSSVAASAAKSVLMPLLRSRRDRVTPRALVGPPAAPALDVFARRLAEIGRADDEDLEALRPGLVAPPRPRRDAHRVPLLDLDDLVVELHPPAPAHDHVHLLLLEVRVAVREAIAGRDALVAQAGLLELERLGRQAELQVRRAVEVGPDVLQVLLEVAQRERHGRAGSARHARQ